MMEQIIEAQAAMKAQFEAAMAAAAGHVRAATAMGAFIASWAGMISSSIRV